AGIPSRSTATIFGRCNRRSPKQPLLRGSPPPLSLTPLKARASHLWKTTPNSTELRPHRPKCSLRFRSYSNADQDKIRTEDGNGHAGGLRENPSQARRGEPEYCGLRCRPIQIHFYPLVRQGISRPLF